MRTQQVIIACVVCIFILWLIITTTWVQEIKNHPKLVLENSVPIEQPRSENYSPPIGKTVFVEISIDGIDYGRIDIGLFTYDVPKTTENFRSLVTGERGNGQSFIGTKFHRIITNFVIQGGGIYEKGGFLSRAEYDSFVFDDEPRGLELKHSGRYIVQMANRGPNSNNSQFCFMLKESKHLNGKHVVFGRVTKGFEIVDAIENLAASPSGEPRAEVIITAGGEYVE